MGNLGLTIRDDLSVDELRRLARCKPDGATATRMYAIANALDGMSRTLSASGPRRLKAGAPAGSACGRGDCSGSRRN
jgi:hypothetical protein